MRFTSRRTRVIPGLAAFFIAAAQLPSAAQEAAPKKELPWKSTEVRLGAFFSSSDAGIEVKSDLGAGASVDFEDALGMSSSTVAFRAEASFALGARHRLHLDLFSLSREGERTLDRDIQIGDTVFPAGSGVNSESDFDMYMLTYGYSIFQDDQFDFSVTFGLHGLRMSMDVDADVVDRHESVSLFLPIPLPGIRFDAALTPDLWLRQRAEFIWIAVGDYAGILADLTVRLEYAIGETFSVGIGFNSIQIRLESENDDAAGVGFEGSVELGFSGLMLYAGAQF